MAEEIVKRGTFSFKTVIQYLLLLSLAGVLLYFSFKGVKWSDFINGLRSCNFWWIASSMIVGIIGFIIRALRWQLLLRPLNGAITFKESYNGVTLAYFTNFIFPRAGELARCGVVAREKKVTFEGALGTVVVERGIDLICLIFWVASLLLFKWNEFGGFLSNQIIDPLFTKIGSSKVALAIAGVLLALTAMVCIAGWIYRKRLMQSALFKKLAGIIKGLVQGLLTLFRMKEKWLFILYTLMIWGTYWLTSYTTIRAFSEVSYLDGTDALFLMIVGGLGWVVPVQGGLGAYHFIVSMALASVYSISQTSGVVFATISHESQALVMLLCGAISLVQMGWSVKQIRK